MLDFISQLRRDYPRLYPDSLPDYMIEVPAGWEGIVRELSASLRNSATSIGQIKQKSANLCAYFEPIDDGSGFEDDLSLSAFTVAEAKAKITCEECGAPGTEMKRRSWYVVLCAVHAAESDSGKAPEFSQL